MGSRDTKTRRWLEQEMRDSEWITVAEISDLTDYLASLTDAEAQQLLNIDTSVISVANWAALSLLASGTTRITYSDSPYTILSTDGNIFVDTDNGAIIVNLPAGTDDRKYRIVNCGTSDNDVTITPNGTEQVLGEDEGDSFTMYDGEAVDMTFNSTEGWY